MILFVLGLLIGGCVGMLMTALCVAAKKDDVRGKAKGMNTICKVSRFLFQPIQVEEIGRAHV